MQERTKKMTLPAHEGTKAKDAKTRIGAAESWDISAKLEIRSPSRLFPDDEAMKDSDAASQNGGQRSGKVDPEVQCGSSLIDALKDKAAPRPPSGCRRFGPKRPDAQDAVSRMRENSKERSPVSRAAGMAIQRIRVAARSESWAGEYLLIALRLRVLHTRVLDFRHSRSATLTSED